MDETRNGADMLLDAAVLAADTLGVIERTFGEFDAMPRVRVFDARSELLKALAAWGHIPCEMCGEVFADAMLFRVELRPVDVGRLDTLERTPTVHRFCSKCLRSTASTVVVETRQL